MIDAKKGFLVDGKISPSQLKCWVKSPKEYIKYYIKGLPRPTSKYMEFGTFIHEALEKGHSENPTLDMLISIVPRLEVPEQKVNVPTKINKVDVILNGILDSYDIDNDELIDYKTGKVGNWSQEAVASDIQFAWYALIHKTMTKRDLKKVTVVHLHTTEEDGEVFLTGDYDIYEYTPTKKDIDNVKAIFTDFVEWTKTLTPEMLSSETNKEVDMALQRIAEIKAQIEVLETEEDNLRAIIVADMEKSGQLEIKNDIAHVYFTTRRTWEYSPEIKSIEKSLKKEKEEWEKDHEPKTITKSMTLKVLK